MTLDAIKILVCDDSILSRKKLKDILITLNCQNITEAADGQASIDSYKAIHPDLVFLDIVMPIKDGITAIHEIREYDKDARIVITSSIGTQKNLKAAITAGAADFIQKPPSIEQVEKAVAATLKGGN